MTSARHLRAKELFLAACRQPLEQRPTFLARACKGDIELEAEVRELLEFHDAETDQPHVPASEAGSIEDIPRYRVLQRVGAGGMGDVYEAEQLAPVRRRVALKVIRWGMDSREVLARFESERQALALMSHAAIARVFDAGVTSRGRPFFAMEFIRGVPITEYCDAQRSTTRERMELFLQTCDGVQHAHQRGVIHRDLKPSNILVTLEGERALPKIIDFGVAKAISQRLTEQTVFTALGQWIGTPEYMSPEQAGMTGLDIDTRTDVYSLGVILYELLVGAQPFDSTSLRGRGFDEMRRRIREDDPPRPSTRVSSLGPHSELTAQRRRTSALALAKELRGDLDWIVMRALEKDRTRRYSTPRDLAEDVRRHLRHEPVEAGPPGELYRASKFVRRHRFGVAAGALAVLSMLVAIVGTTIGMTRARQEAETAKRVVRLMREMLWTMGPGSPTGHTMPIREFLARGRERVELELAGSPLLQAEMMSILGEVHLSLGELDAAKPLLEAALETRVQLLGSGDPSVGHSRNALGVLRLQSGDFAAATKLFDEAASILEPAFGSDDAVVANVFANLCSAHWRLGMFVAALTDCDRALEVLEQREGTDSLNVAATLVIKASVLRDLGRFEDAEACDRRSLAIRERLLGPDHTLVGWTVASLGLDERIRGNLESATTHLERALAIQRAALGPDSSALALPLEQLGQARADQGDLPAARDLLARALKIRERALGSDHPDLIWTLRPYGDILRRSGEPAAARRALTRALEMSERQFGASHLEVARSLSALAHDLVQDGDLERARQLIERAAEIRTRIHGANSPLTGIVWYNLACVAARQGRTSDALALLERALDTGWAWPGARTDPDLGSLRGNARFEQLMARLRSRLPRS